MGMAVFVSTCNCWSFSVRPCVQMGWGHCVTTSTIDDSGCKDLGCHFWV